MWNYIFHFLAWFSLAQLCFCILVNRMNYSLDAAYFFYFILFYFFFLGGGFTHWPLGDLNVILMLLNLTDDKLTLVQYWPRSTSPYDITKMKPNLESWNCETTPVDFIRFKMVDSVGKVSKTSDSYLFHQFTTYDLTIKKLWKLNTDKFDILIKKILLKLINSNILIKKCIPILQVFSWSLF